MKKRKVRTTPQPRAVRELRQLRAFLSEAYVATGALVDLSQPGAERLLDNLFAASEGRPLPHRHVVPTWADADDGASSKTD